MVAFSKDYELMQNMIYGSKPTFEEIMKVIGTFEEELNDTIKSNADL